MSRLTYNMKLYPAMLSTNWSEQGAGFTFNTLEVLVDAYKGTDIIEDFKVIFDSFTDVCCNYAIRVRTNVFSKGSKTFYLEIKDLKHPKSYIGDTAQTLVLFLKSFDVFINAWNKSNTLNIQLDYSLTLSTKALCNAYIRGMCESNSFRKNNSKLQHQCELVYRSLVKYGYLITGYDSFDWKDFDMPYSLFQVVRCVRSYANILNNLVAKEAQSGIVNENILRHLKVHKSSIVNYTTGISDRGTVIYIYPELRFIKG